MYTLLRNENEIADVLNRCCEQEDEGGSRYPGMSFEQGVAEAIHWLCEEGVDAGEGWPFQDE